MNILIKLTCLIGLVIAPILGSHTEDAEIVNVQAATVIEQPIVTGQESSTEISIDRQKNADGKVTAKVTITTKTNKEEVLNEQKTFEGTEEEVNAQIEALKNK